MVDLMGAVQLVVPGGQGRDAQRAIDRRGQVLRRLRVRSPGARRSGPTSRRPGRRPRRRRRRRPSARGPSGRGRAACRPAGSGEILGVRPNSPAITISVESSRPLSCRSSSRAETARSVGGRRLSFRCGKALPCVSQVSLLPRLTCTRLDPRLDQPPGHQQRPAEGVAAVAVEQPRVGVRHVEGPPDPWRRSAARRPPAVGRRTARRRPPGPGRLAGGRGGASRSSRLASRTPPSPSGSVRSGTWNRCPPGRPRAVPGGRTRTRGRPRRRSGRTATPR